MIPTEPKKIDMPFAYEGAKNDIPTTGGEETGNASLSLGFPPITSEPINQGGIPPQRKDFNGILYVLSAYAHYAQSGALYSYDAAVDYIPNCIITYGNNIYICLANNGPSTSAGAVTPGTNENYWQTLYTYLQAGDTGTVGSATNPVYVTNGKITASGATVGGTARGMYLNAGVMTAMTGTVGGTAQPVYMNNGTATALTASAGGTAQPVRLNAGKIEALTATVGDDETPVFLKSGVLTACSGVGGGVKDYKLGESGYVRFEIGLIIQWGNRSNTGGTSGEYTVTFPVSFTSGSSYVIVKNGGTNRGGNLRDKEQGFYNKTATTATTTQTNSVSCIDEWLAIGF